MCGRSTSHPFGNRWLASLSPRCLWSPRLKDSISVVPSASCACLVLSSFWPLSLTHSTANQTSCLLSPCCLADGESVLPTQPTKSYNVANHFPVSSGSGACL